MLAASDVERFWSKVEREGGPDACWVWLGSRLPKGYGTFHVGGRNGRVLKAHRVALALSGVAVGDRDHVLHSCDNPPCCNPAHLRVGTNRENVEDAAVRGRRHGGRGERHGMAKLTAKEVAEIRALPFRRYAKRSGTSLSQIARRFEVSLSCISAIVNGQTWKAVTP